MRRKAFLFLLLSLALLAAGCGERPAGGTAGAVDAGDSGSASAGTETSVSAAESDGAESSEIFSSRDFEVGYAESESAVIELNGDSAACASDAVQISGGTVTITDEGTYILSGTLHNGTIIIDAEKTDKTQLVLDGATIHSESSAAIYVRQADKVFITLASDSVNTLSNGGSFAAIDENNIDAVVFSRDDLCMNGSGSLTIVSPAGHGVVSKDELSVTSGVYTVTASSHGLSANDNVCIANASISIVSGKDGIQAAHDSDASLGFVYMESGSLDITSGGDGLSASAYMQINGGSLRISAGGGSANVTGAQSGLWSGGQAAQASEEEVDSMKGLKAAGSLLINGGSFTIDAADDAVHSNADLRVNGGEFSIAT
ncbi:MAG: carbohydrate-binding domain-containing protein, partial [Clostridia bacterium]|nr:carbohydrate-binding domain-containing protein [Clostridia bacterium]